MAQPRVLIVDDEAGIRRTLTGILEDDGYNVEAAGTGEEGMDRFQEFGIGQEGLIPVTP